MEAVADLRDAQLRRAKQERSLHQEHMVDIVHNCAAEEVLNRLVELGCKPADLQEAMKTVEFPFYDDPKQQIESDYDPDAVKLLSEMADAFKDDYPTRKLIEKWIDGEVEHMAWEAQYLNYIDKLGYENFLTAMM